MADTLENQNPNHSSGLCCVIAVAQEFDIAADIHQVWHVHGKFQNSYTQTDIIRCAIRLGLRARSIPFRIGDIENDLTPCVITEKKTGKHFLVRRISNPYAELQCPVTDTFKRIKLSELEKEFLPEWVIFARQPDKQKSDAKSGFAWFIPSIVKHGLQFRRIFIASLIIQAFALASPKFFEVVIDKVLVSRGLQTLDVLVIGLLAIAFFEPLMTFFRSIIFAHFASCVNAEISARLYRHLIYLPLQYFRKRRVGEIMARVREMDQVRSFLTGSALMMIIDLLFVGVFLFAMFSYSYQLTYIVLATMVVFAIIWVSFSPVLRRRVETDYEARAKNTAFITECVTGMETIKSLGVNDRFANEWKEHVGASLKASLRANLLGHWAGGGIELVQKLFSALILWFGVSLVLDGELSVGQLVAFNMLSGHVTLPVLRLAQIWPDFQHTGVALKRISAILDAETETVVSAGRSSLDYISGNIELRNVHFRYSSDSIEVLRQLNVKVKAGEVIGITGESGSGKSTITKLLQRLYLPQEGQVLIDNVDLAMADPAMLRRHLGVVLQESFLFNGSVYENIALGDPLASPEQIQHAAIISGTDEFVRELPDAYMTNVGERGCYLSGGQRQRIALARALVGNPTILILDEATSALDYETEAAILTRLPEIVRNRTVFMIAHRLNCMPICDRILVLDKGQIVEQGDHHQLLQQAGIYTSLWNLQNRE